MLFWEEPVVSAFVRAAAFARGKIDHVHGVCVYTYEAWMYTSNLSVFFLRSCAMGQAEELYFALIDVGYTARRCKIPGPLSQTARDWLEGG